MNDLSFLSDCVGIGDISDFNEKNNEIIYSIGNRIVTWELTTNTKCFCNMGPSDIICVKYIGNTSLFISVDNAISIPMICVWEKRLDKIKCISKENIPIRHQFKINQIIIEEISLKNFVALITSIDCSLLYSFSFSNQEIRVNFVGQILSENEIDNDSEVFDFKAFILDDEVIIVIMYKNSISWHKITKTKIFLKSRIRFRFNLLPQTLRISKNEKYSVFLTENGNCLIYDTFGNKIAVITPVNNEKFINCALGNNGVIVGSDEGKLYYYFYTEKLNAYIDLNASIIDLKEKFEIKLLENNIQQQKENKKVKLKKMYYNENNDKLMIISDSIVFLSSLSNLVVHSNTRSTFAFNSVGNVNFYFSLINSRKILSLTSMNPYPYIFIGSSLDSNIYINKKSPDNKIITTFLNFPTYITVIKTNNSQIFCGDNNGILYILSELTKGDKIVSYKKYKIGSFAISSIDFSVKGRQIAIGFITGMVIICDLNNECEFCVRLSENFFDPNEIALRLRNNHSLSFCYYFKSTPKRKYLKDNENLIIYMKSHNIVEISKIEASITMISSRVSHAIKIQKNILDIDVHASENYLIALTSIKTILITQISNGEVTAVIDLNFQTDSINSISLDPSGLYLSLICSLRGQKPNTSIIIFEIGTGKSASVFTGMLPMSKCSFDNNGINIGIGCETGQILLVTLSKEIQRAIRNVKREEENNAFFWEEYEIKYYMKGEIQKNYINEYVQAEIIGGDYEKVETMRESIRKDNRLYDSDEDKYYRNHKEKEENIFDNNLKNLNDNENMSLQECYQKRKIKKSKPKYPEQEKTKQSIEKSTAEQEVDLYDLRNDIVDNSDNKMYKSNQSNYKEVNKSIKMNNDTLSKSTKKKIPKSEQIDYKSKTNIEENEGLSDEMLSNYNKNNIVLNQDPNIYPNGLTRKSNQKNEVNNDGTKQSSVSALNKKIIADSSSHQQNDIRIKNIANAINEMLLSPSPQMNPPPQPYTSPMQIKQSSPISSGSYQNTRENSKDYFINNNNNNNTNFILSSSQPKKYPEPIDIDDDIVEPKVINKYIPTRSNNNDSFSILRTNNNAQYQKTSLTDQIDYFDNNINNFESLHKIK